MIICVNNRVILFLEYHRQNGSSTNNNNKVLPFAIYIKYIIRVLYGIYNKIVIIIICLNVLLRAAVIVHLDPLKHIILLLFNNNK